MSGNKTNSSLSYNENYNKQNNQQKSIVRTSNEDRVCIILNINKPVERQHENWPKASFFGVYDGHGGPKCADYIKDNLHKNVTSQSCFPQNPKLALQKGFEQTEKQFMDEVMDNYKKTTFIERSGCCALVLLIIDDICYTANLGDCRAIISKQNGEICQQLTRDHKPSDDKEKIRILNSGGNVYQSKVPHFQYSSLKYKNQQQQVLVGPVRILPGRLSISRGFGDAEAKFEEFGGNNKVLIATPEITQFKIEDNFDFILLGCDGIYDCVQNKELVGVIWEAYKNRENLQIQNAHQFLGKAAEISLNIAAYKKSTDNLTTVIVGFKQLAQLFGEDNQENILT